MKLQGFKEISGIIECVTGLHIGGSSNIIEIGGVDTPIIRNPLNNLPYIPGSSLKGKVRTLLEWELGKVPNDGKPHSSCSNNECPICRIFGTTDESLTRLPSRALFRDAFLTGKSMEKLDEMRKEKGVLYAEIKYENTIDRLRGKTLHGGLRRMERIPSGIRFNFSIAYRVFDELDKQGLNYLLHGLWLLEQDALGGCGSRGYGKVVFINEAGENKVKVRNESGEEREEEIRDRSQEIQI